MIKIVGIIFITLIFSLILKDYNKQFSILLIIACSIILLALSSGYIKDIFETIKGISSQINGLNSYISLLIKLLGIAIISQITASLCRDCSEQALANQTELYSKVFMLALSLPLFEAVIGIVIGLVK